MNILLVAWKLLDRGQRQQLVVLQLLSLLMALSTVSGIAVVLPFLTVLADPGAIQRNALLRFAFEHFGRGEDHAFLIVLGTGFLVVTLLANGVNLLGSLAMNRFAFRVGGELQSVLFDEYLQRSYGFHSSVNSATLSNKVIYESSRLTSGILQSGLILVANLVTIVCIAASIVALSPWVASLASLCLGAGYAVGYVLVRGNLHRNGLVESRSHCQRTQIVNEGFGAIKEVIVLGIERHFVENFERTCRDISRSTVSTTTLSQSPRYLIESIAACALVVMTLQLSGRGSGSPLLAQISFFGMAAYRLMPALQQAFVAGARIRADRAAFLSFAADLRLARDRRGSPGREAPAPEAAEWRGRPRRDLWLRDISYTHGRAHSPILADLTLRIRAGSTVGFIGSNGTGKTTLLDVVSGLLVPQRGRVEIDGVTLDAQNRSAWLTCLAYVPQRAYLCDRTFAENIALGVRNGAIDHDRLRKVVSLAGLDGCVASLPRGYDERLGEHGGRLSGGQRQRLAIARALYRNAPVLLLDESTSSLDLPAESDLTDMLHAERRDRTTLIVAHRLSALRHCDVIHELARGGIVRSGSFDQVNEWIMASSAAEPPQSALPLSQNHQKVIAHVTE